jgi:hypothetical protein
MKRTKKILLWTGISLGTLIAILLICAACYSWILGSRLEKRLTAIKAAGDPICLADLARKPIPPEQNAATYLRRAKDDMEAVDKASMDLKYNDKEDRFEVQEMPRLDEALKAYPNIYPLLEKAAMAADFDFQVDLSLKPHDYLQKCLDELTLIRSGARYLGYRAEVLLSKGDRETTVQTAIVLLKLTRQLDRKPLILTSFLVSNAMKGIALMDAHRALQSGAITDKTREALNAELLLHDCLGQFRNSFITERAFSLDSFRYDIPHPWIISNIWQLSILDVFDEYLNYSSQPYSAWADKNNQRATIKSSLKVLAELFRPAVNQALIAAYRSQALIRALRIINALQKKSPPEGGKIPTMAELGLPDEVGVDPFNGKPMIIKKLPEGWLVYSVGTNLRDDGGNFERGEDGQPIDVGFRPKPAAKEPQENKPDK